MPSGSGKGGGKGLICSRKVHGNLSQAKHKIQPWIPQTECEFGSTKIMRNKDMFVVLLDI